MKNFQFLSTVSPLVSLMFVAASCSRDDDSFISEPYPSVVVSDAGPDRGIILPRDTVTLNGSGMAYHSIVVSYRWRKLSGPVEGSIVNPNNPVTLVRDLVAGAYKFELTVTNSQGKIASDKVCITVYNQDPCLGCWNY